MIPDTAKQLLVHELSNQLTREELSGVKLRCHMPCPIDVLISALRARIAIKHGNVAEQPKTL